MPTVKRQAPPVKQPQTQPVPEEHIPAGPTPLHETITGQAFNIRVNLSSTSTHAQAMSAVDTICTSLQRQEASVEHLRVILGRALVIVSEYKLHEPQYASFEQYSRYVEEHYRLSRATIQNAMLVARRLPNVTAAQAEAIPMTALTLVARAAKDATPEHVEELLERAQEVPFLQFQQELKDTGELPTPARGPQLPDGMVRLVFEVPVEVADHWKWLCGDRPQSEVFTDAVRLLAERGQEAKSTPPARSEAGTVAATRRGHRAA